MHTINEMVENVKEVSHDSNEAQAEISLVKRKVAEQLLNANFDPSLADQSKQLMFEQYRLLIECTNKTEERRGVSNNIFLSINGFIASFFIIRPEQLIHLQMKDLPASMLFALGGLFVSWEWLKVSKSYKKINETNFLLIKALEKFLPTNVFSLKGVLEGRQDNAIAGSQGNVILKKENLLPKAFIFLYFAYFVYIFYFFVNGSI
jgi:hypothetical protein